MSTLIEKTKEKLREARLNEGLRMHEVAYTKAGISMKDDLLQEILYKRFYEVGFKIMDLDPQIVIKEYNRKSSKLWKILNGLS